MIERRTLLKGMLAAGICAPFVVHNSSLLMPVADRGLTSFSITGFDELGGKVTEVIQVPNKVAREYFAYRRGVYISHISQDMFQMAVERRRISPNSGWFCVSGKDTSGMDTYTGSFARSHPAKHSLT